MRKNDVIRKGAILSLAIATGVSAMVWIVSFVAPQHYGAVRSNGFRIVEIRSGTVWIAINRDSRTGKLVRQWQVSRCGFQIYYYRLSGGGVWASMLGPLWCPVALFAIWPTIAFARGPLRRWRRRPLQWHIG